MKYYNQKVSSHGVIHSIDMVYVQYFSLLSPSGILEELRKLHEQFPSVRYEEHLERPMHNKYDFLETALRLVVLTWTWESIRTITEKPKSSIYCQCFSCE